MDKHIFNIDIAGRGLSPASGRLLVAEPFLREKWFRHAVIALVEREPSGSAMGLVLNHRAEVPLQRLLGDVTVREPVPVFLGGPVGTDRLCFLHTLGSDVIPSSVQIAPGLWVGGDFPAALQYVNAGYPLEGHLRFFIGYSGWQGRQLDEELNDHVWAVAEPPEASLLLTGEGDAPWHEAVRRLGPPYRGWLLHPADPSHN